MTHRLGLIGRGALLGMTWGVVAGSFFGTSWQTGALAGLALWGPAVFIGVPGPYAEIIDEIATA